MNITREFLESVSFSPFNENVWEAFSGCESAFPLIGEKDGLTIIVDGNMIAVYSEEFSDGGVWARLDEGRNLSWTEF